jgi:hypothetical protein
VAANRPRPGSGGDSGVGGSDSEALQHCGAKLKVRLGRNGEKSGRWQSSLRKGVGGGISS